MDMHGILFWIFSVAMLLCGVLVITSRSPVNSAMFLVLVFFFLAGLFVLLEAFFLAAIQVLVYAGAVMVLFLFIVMLLDIRASSRRPLALLGGVGAAAVAAMLVWALKSVLNHPAGGTAEPAVDFQVGLATVVKPLFVKYMFPLEVTALLLLVAMIGVVLLSKKEVR